METIICGATAYRYWRVPPIVMYLVAAPVDSPALRRFARQDEILAFRSDLAERLDFMRGCTGCSWRNPGPHSKNIRDASWMLAPCTDFPVDILTQDKCSRRSSQLIKPTLWKGALPFESTRQVSDQLSVTSPAMTMLQLAGHSNVTRAVLLASELCGKYAVYPAPAPIAEELQRLADKGRLTTFGGWRPCLDSYGHVTNLWSREPLTTPEELLQMSDNAAGRPGCATLRQAAQLVLPNAASPFETQAGILLGFSRRNGGEGFQGLKHNEKVELNRDAKLIAARSCCYCDLYWPSGLDVECQSAQYHDNMEGLLSDSDRTAALSLMGVSVLPLTYEKMADERSFAAFSSAVARALGIRQQAKSAAELEASRRLRAEVFASWSALPNVTSVECAP